jgi:hypothetical protein
MISSSGDGAFVAYPAHEPRTRWQTAYFVLTGALASTILLKFDQIQYLEVIDLIQIIALLFVFIRRDYRVIWFRPFLHIGIGFLIYAILVSILAIASLRYDFYVPLEFSSLKGPGVIAVSRVVELAADVCGMLYLAHQFRLHPSWLRFTMRVYFWAGMASSVYSLISYPLAVLGIAELGTHEYMHRVKGFYNEGGPYGLYVLSLIVVGVILWRLVWERPRRIYWCMAALLPTLLLTYSKAAFLALFLLLAINMIFAASFTQRLIVLASGTVLLAVVFHFVNLSLALQNYIRVSASYERASHLHVEDPSFVYGRIAGLFIVPRMVAAHPLTGIGWGNYGYLRNDPKYRGAATSVKGSDDPGLGIWGLTAEVGLPLFFYLIVLLGMPFFFARRRRVPLYVSSLALLQLVAHFFGAQLNLTYPWVITAFALGLIYLPATTLSAEAAAPNRGEPLSRILETGESHG